MCNEKSLKMNCTFNLGADTLCLEKAPFEGFVVVAALYLLFEEIHLGLSNLFS